MTFDTCEAVEAALVGQQDAPIAWGTDHRWPLIEGAGELGPVSISLVLLLLWCVADGLPPANLCYYHL